MSATGSGGCGPGPASGAGSGASNPRKFSEKIALHTQRQAEETAAFQEVMMDITSTRVSERRRQEEESCWRKRGLARTRRAPGERCVVSLRGALLRFCAVLAAITSWGRSVWVLLGVCALRDALLFISDTSLAQLALEANAATLSCLLCYVNVAVSPAAPRRTPAKNRTF